MQIRLSESPPPFPESFVALSNGLLQGSIAFLNPLETPRVPIKVYQVVIHYGERAASQTLPVLFRLLLLPAYPLAMLFKCLTRHLLKFLTEIVNSPFGNVDVYSDFSPLLQKVPVNGGATRCSR